MNIREDNHRKVVVGGGGPTAAPADQEDIYRYKKKYSTVNS